MKIDVGNLISISEADQNFSKVTRLVDERGTAIILNDNDVDLDTIASQILTKHIEAFKELAK